MSSRDTDPAIEQAGILTIRKRNSRNDIVGTAIYCGGQAILNSTGKPGTVQVNGQGEFRIYADIIVIDGCLTLPGQNLLLFCRHLTWRRDGVDRPAKLDLRGKDGEPGSVGAIGSNGLAGGQLTVHCRSAAPSTKSDGMLMIDNSGGSGGAGGAREHGSTGAPYGGFPGLPGFIGFYGSQVDAGDFSTTRVLGRFGRPWNVKGVRYTTPPMNIPVRENLQAAAKVMDVSHAEMLLQQARKAFFSSDPETDNKGRLLALPIVERLFDLTSNLPENLQGQPRYQALQAKVTALMTQLGNHVDYFGHAYDWVPLISESTLTENYKRAVEHYKSLVDLQSVLMKGQLTKAERLSQIEALRNKAEAFKGVNQTRLQALVKELHNKNVALDGLVSKAKDAKSRLKGALQQWTQHAPDPSWGASGVSWEDVAGVLQMLSFMPHSAQAPAPTAAVPNPTLPAGAAVFSAATQAFNVSSQMLELGNKVLNYTKTDDGQPVRRDYVVSQTRQLASGLDLVKELPLLKEHFLESSDRGQTLLFAERDQIKHLCDSFRNSFGNDVANVDRTLDEWVNTIQLQNNAMQEYNRVVGQLLECHSHVVEAEEQINNALQQAQGQSDPNVEIYTVFLNGLCEQARADCLYHLYAAQRAVEFSSLEPCRDLLEFEHPFAITVVELEHKIAKLAQVIEAELESRRHPPQHFPPLDLGKGHWGKFLVMTEEDFGEELAELRSTGSTIAFLPVVRNNELSADSPFRYLSNVRVSKVRAWFVGDRPEHAVVRQVRITHLGVDDICSEKGHLLSARHDPVSVVFEYREDRELGGLGGIIDNSLNNTAARSLYSQLTDTISIDGDMHRLKESESGSFASVGPFTSWQIECLGWVPEDLKNVYLEFHGSAYSFNA